ncbi:MAG: hypothetical protein ABIY48_07015 [Acidimicrobiales bacterium]
MTHIPSIVRSDHSKQMDALTTIDDHQVEALLAGTSLGDADLAPLARVTGTLRRLAEVEPVPPMSAALRAQLAGGAVIPIGHHDRHRRLHGAGVHRAARRSLTMAAVAAAATAVALVGVGATQNRLPTSVQNVVSSTAHIVGIDVPRAEDRGAPDPGSDLGGANGSSGSTSGANDGTPGYDGVTPGGATPADPGTPGDHEPATPATPPSNPPANASDGKAAADANRTESPATTAVPRGHANSPTG